MKAHFPVIKHNLFSVININKSKLISVTPRNLAYLKKTDRGKTKPDPIIGQSVAWITYVWNCILVLSLQTLERTSQVRYYVSCPIIHLTYQKIALLYSKYEQFNHSIILFSTNLLPTPSVSAKIPSCFWM